MALRDLDPRCRYFAFMILNIKPTLLSPHACLQGACEVGVLHTAEALAYTTVACIILENTAAHCYSHKIVSEHHIQYAELHRTTLSYSANLPPKRSILK